MAPEARFSRLSPIVCSVTEGSHTGCAVLACEPSGVAENAPSSAELYAVPSWYDASRLRKENIGVPAVQVVKGEAHVPVLTRVG